MNITMVITSYHPIVGGAERQLAQIGKAMAEEGHAVTVVTRHHAGLPRREVIGGVQVVRVGFSRLGPVGTFATLFAAALAVWKSKPSVVHCHSLFSPALAGSIGGWLAGVPVLAKPMCGGEAESIARKTFGQMRIAFFRRRLSALVAISEEIETELVALGFQRARIVMIPNGVDTDRFHPPADVAEKRAARQALGLPDGFVFAFAGRLAAQKMVPLLLEAFQKVHRARPDAALAIASANRAAGGETGIHGQVEPEIRPLLEGKPGIFMLGAVEDMPRLLSAVDAFVLPSSREGLSNALLEACASGLPTISARIGGNVEIVEDAKTGLLFEAGSEADLVAKMMRLVEDPAFGRQLGHAARARVEEHFALRQTVRRLLALYHKLQAGHA